MVVFFFSFVRSFALFYSSVSKTSWASMNVYTWILKQMKPRWFIVLFDGISRWACKNTNSYRNRMLQFCINKKRLQCVFCFWDLVETHTRKPNTVEKKRRKECNLFWIIYISLMLHLHQQHPRRQHSSWTISKSIFCSTLSYSNDVRNALQIFSFFRFCFFPSYLINSECVLSFINFDALKTSVWLPIVYIDLICRKT